MQAKRQGVFISHITEERITALLLKDLLRHSYSNELPIFVSSDYDSIPGGDVWFTAIVNGLKSSDVIIVLLSPDSLDRRWINFEAGVGVGADATVIPVVVHLLNKGDVGHPLTSLQIRSLQSLEEAHARFSGTSARRSTAFRMSLIVFRSSLSLPNQCPGADGSVSNGMARSSRWKARYSSFRRWSNKPIGRRSRMHSIKPVSGCILQIGTILAAHSLLATRSST